MFNNVISYVDLYTKIHPSRIINSSIVRFVASRITRSQQWIIFIDLRLFTLLSSPYPCLLNNLTTIITKTIWFDYYYCYYCYIAINMVHIVKEIRNNSIVIISLTNADELNRVRASKIIHATYAYCFSYSCMHIHIHDPIHTLVLIVQQYDDT